MLTVLHTESSAGWGGQENRTLYECLGLKRLGARPIILARPESKLLERARAAGIEVRSHRLSSNRDLSAILYMLRIIKEEGVDVVSTHSGDDSLLGALAGRLSSRKPAIVRTRHLSLPITSKATYSLLPHMVVTVSESVRDYLVNGKGIRAGKVVSIPTGVDLKRFDPSTTQETLKPGLGLKDGALVVGTVAILRRKKGHHILLEAIPGILREVPEAVFVIAGNGPQRDALEKRIGELGVGESVKMLGLRNDIPGVLKGLDLFVLPTLQEALGTSILEASAMGKAVVATRVGGVPEAVRDGVTGLLVPPEDPEGLKAAVVRLLRDNDLRKNMGEAGRRMVVDGYSMDMMAERMFSLYDGLTGGRGR